MVNKIKHVHAYRQGNRPICGIYALLNGLYDYHLLDIKKIKNLAEQLWETSIKDKYSIIGEFSSSTDLRDFIIKSASKILMDTSKLEKHTITDVSLVCPCKLKEIIKNGKISKKTFYIIPINPHITKKQEANVFHWICLKKNDKSGEIVIANSNTTAETKALSAFCGKKYHFAKFNNLEQIYGSFESMEELKNKPLNIGYWINSKIKNYPKRIKKQIESNKVQDQKITYHNDKDTFCALEIKYQ